MQTLESLLKKGTTILKDNGLEEAGLDAWLLRLLIMSANLLSVLPAHWMISKEIPATTGTIRSLPNSLTQ